MKYMMGSTLSSQRIRLFFWVWLGTLLAAAALPIPARAQNFQWVRQFGSSLTEQGNAVAAGPSGIYVAGNTTGAFPGQTNAGRDDVFVSRYDALGNQLWSRQFGSPSADPNLITAVDIGKGVAADATGVYVVGTTRGALPGQSSAGNTDAFVRKYDVNGTEQWTRQFGTSSADEALGVAVDATGVYVAGWTLGQLPGQTRVGGVDAFVRKYDANGNELWTRQFGPSSGGSAGHAYGVAADATGIYVVGSVLGALPGQTFAGGFGDAYVRKYDASGNVVWTRQFGSADRGSDYGYAVAVSASGVYVTGETSSTFPGQTRAGGVSDAFVRKYDVNGIEQWTRQFGTANGAIGLGVAAGANGVYVVGYVGGALPGQTYVGQKDVFVRTYDFNGTELGTRQFGNTGSDEAYGVAVDGTGAYVTGGKSGNALAQTPLGGQDAFVLKVLPAPVTSDASVVSSATYAPSPAPVAPGSIASVFGTYLNDGSQVFFTSFGPDGRLVTSLGEASVTLNNIPAPTFASLPGQLAIQIPFELAGLSSATIQVTVAGQTSAPSTVFLDAVVPGIFTVSQDGKGAAVIIHQDGVTPVSTQSPARPGEIVVLYATGLGAVTPPLATGAPSTGNQTVLTPTVTVGGIPAEILFSGVAPGFVGLNQVNLRIPSNAPSAPNVPMVLSIGGKQSNPVTIAVAP